MSGYAVVAAFVLIFATMVVATCNLLTSYDEKVEMIQSAKFERFDRIFDERHTDLMITNIKSSVRRILVYVENSGGVILNPDYAFAFVDGIFFPEVNYTNETNASDRYWEPADVFVINITNGTNGLDLYIGSHWLKVGAENGVSTLNTSFLVVKLWANLSASPSVVNSGESVVITMDVTNTGFNDLINVTPKNFDWNFSAPCPGCRANYVDGPNPAKISLLPIDESGSFNWTYTLKINPNKVGYVTFSAYAEGIDAVYLTTIQSETVYSNAVKIVG